MPSFRCPQCGNVVAAESAQGLACPKCGYGSTREWQPAGGFAPAPPSTGTGPVCPRCRSTYTKAGGIPTWAVVLSIVGFFVVCVFSLLFLLIKEESVCYQCGLHWR